MLPNLVIIGAQKSWTSSLFKSLRKCRGVATSSYTNEVHYLDNNYHLDIEWYKSHFLKRDDIVLEKTPYYLFHPAAPARAYETIPNAKFVVLLRDPIDRLISQWHHEHKHGFDDSRDIREALFKEHKSMRQLDENELFKPDGYSYAHQHYTYFSRGKYKEQVERWLEYFSKDRFLFIESERYFENEHKVIEEVLEFGGAENPDASNVRVGKKSPNSKKSELDKDLLDHLEYEYRKYNAGLNELTGVDFRWNT